MITIGITGPPGVGKTTVAKRLEELGACVVFADEIAQMLLDDPIVSDRVAEVFGSEVMIGDKVDRTALGDKVFTDQRALKMLNRLVHPLLLDELARKLRAMKTRGCSVSVIDAALILEWGIEDGLDLLVYVDAPESTRMKRLLARPGMTPAKARGILNAQLPAFEKCDMCDLTIDAGGELSHTLAQVDLLWKRLDEEVADVRRRKNND